MSLTFTVILRRAGSDALFCMWGEPASVLLPPAPSSSVSSLSFLVLTVSTDSGVHPPHEPETMATTSVSQPCASLLTCREKQLLHPFCLFQHGKVKRVQISDVTHNVKPQSFNILFFSFDALMGSCAFFLLMVCVCVCCL